MKRNLARCCSFVFLLAALGVTGPTAMAAGGRVVARGTVWGQLTLLQDGSFTIQSRGTPSGAIGALTAAANRVTGRAYPYVYGGGHAQAGIASVGIPGAGYNGRRLGFDCSGSVAAVLSGAGLWPAGEGVPNDAGIVAQMLSAGLIARGAGRGPVEVTLYDDPGVHIFMNIDGRFFGTSDGAGGGNRRGGAGWLNDGAPDASSRHYRRYHVLASVLKRTTNAGHSVTFDDERVSSTLSSLQLGQKIKVKYVQTDSGILIATDVVLSR